MTTSATELSSIDGVLDDAPMTIRALSASSSRRARSSEVTSRSSARVFFRMIPGTSLGVGRLIAPGIDLRLRANRNGLVRRQGVDREKPARVPGEPIHRDHPYPAIHGGQRSALLARQQVLAQRRDLAQRVSVIENEEFLGRLPRIAEVHRRESVAEPRRATEAAASACIARRSAD